MGLGTGQVLYMKTLSVQPEMKKTELTKLTSRTDNDIKL